MSRAQTTWKWLLVIFALLIGGWHAIRVLDNDHWARWLAVGFALITAVHGSWRIIPIMLLSFVVGEAVSWGLFYSVDHYIPQTDDVLMVAAISLNLAAVCGAGRMLCWRELQSNHGKDKISRLVPKLIFFAAMFLLGNYVGGLAFFTVYNATGANELVAFALAIGCSIAIWSAATLLSRSSLNGTMPAVGSGMPRAASSVSSVEC